jgi:hemolysin type calcium-binding protein/WD40 repeat protein
MSFQSLKRLLTDRTYRGAVKRRLALVVLALVGLLVAAGQLARAAAGPEPDDIQDSLPAWNADGTRVVFDRTAPGLQHVVTMTSAGRDLYVASSTGIVRGFVPGGGEPAFMLVQTGGDTILTIGGRFAGPAAEVHGIDATASPDGTRLAYLREGTLYVARLDSVKLNAFPIPVPAEAPVAIGVTPPSWDVTGPVWSPDGRQIAVASGSSLLLVSTDGSGSRVLFSGANQSVNPSWSPDGSTIAFERNAAAHWEIWTIPADGSSRDARVWSSGSADFRYPQFSPHSDTIAFISDLQHVRGGATPYQFALYVRPLAGGALHKLVDDVHPYSPPRWSPTAALIAVSAGQECRRWGIYVGRSNVGSRFTRRSNLCRFNGTTGHDRIGGSEYFDIINGLAGNDTLLGRGGNDAVYGENGNDSIAGGAGNDFIVGGPGNDRLFGGAGNDVIIGGNGRDVIDCGPGVDTVEGAGPLDRVAKNCEHVGR